MLRRSIVVASCACALFGLSSAMKAEAQSFSFTFNGGPWSIHYHSGWHRYWGGTSVGYYYAPRPVYVVPGYTGETYYTGPTYWRNHPEAFRHHRRNNDRRNGWNHNSGNRDDQSNRYRNDQSDRYRNDNR